MIENVVGLYELAAAQTHIKWVTFGTCVHGQCVTGFLLHLLAVLRHQLITQSCWLNQINFNICIILVASL